MIAPEDIPVFSLLENKTARQICAYLINRETMTQKELWTKAGTYQQAALWYIEQLEAQGIITKRKKGKNTLYSITGRLDEVKEHSGMIWDAFRDNLVKKLEADGVAPRVVRNDRKGVIIQLDSGQRKFNLKVEKI